MNALVSIRNLLLLILRLSTPKWIIFRIRRMYELYMLVQGYRHNIINIDSGFLILLLGSEKSVM